MDNMNYSDSIMHWDNNQFKEAFEHEVMMCKEEFGSKFKLIEKKDSKLMKFIATIIKPFNPTFMNDYITTIGSKIYFPTGYLTDGKWKGKLFTLWHERIHMRQFRKYSFIGMSILYIFIPFPTKFAYYRKKFEQEAYAIDIAATFLIKGKEYVLDKKFRDFVLKQFCGSWYGFTWYSKDSIIKWLEYLVDGIDSGSISLEFLIDQYKK